MNADHATSRRNVLKLGSLGAAGAVLLAACGSDEPLGVSGAPGPTEGPVPTVPKRPLTEAELTEIQVQLHTLASVEALAAKVYKDHASSVTNPDVAPALATYASDHDAAAKALVALTDDKAEDEPNAELVKVWLTPAEPNLKDNETAVLNLMHQIESSLTATYIAALPQLREAKMRGEIMAYGAAAARRVTVLGDNGKGEIPGDAMFPPLDQIPNAAYLRQAEGEEAEG